MSALLKQISNAKKQYVLAKTSLETRLREQLKEEMSSLQSQIDVAVRMAYEKGESKAAILRALGTKDYHTVNGCLQRTVGIDSVNGVGMLPESYQLEGDRLRVDYDDHGPKKITGQAEFTYEELADGTRILFALTPMYSEDYAVRNEVVAVLDQRTEGYYYEEAMDFIDGQK